MKKSGDETARKSPPFTEGAPGAPADPIPQSLMLKFRPVRELARGGYGRVVLATQVAFDRPVALKLLLADVMRSPDEVRRFEQEAMVTAALSHPGIVKVYDAGVAEGVPWIALEFLQGRTLKQRLESGSFTVAEAVSVMAAISAAVEHAHSKGVLHRDLKPANVVQSEVRSWKVTDFGIARWENQKAILTRTGTIIGTPDYLAPEVVKGEVPTAAADLYALGVIFFELVAGRLPFEFESIAETLKAHQIMVPPSLQSVVPQVSTALDSLVARLLAKAPADRPSSAAELVSALSRIDGTRSVSTGSATVALARSSFERKPSLTRAIDRDPATRAPLSARPGRGVALVLTLAALVVFGVRVWRPTPPQPVQLKDQVSDGAAWLDEAARDLEVGRDDLERRWSLLARAEEGSWSIGATSGAQFREMCKASLSLCEEAMPDRVVQEVLDRFDSRRERIRSVRIEPGSVQVVSLTGRRDAFRFVNWFLVQRAHHWARLYSRHGRDNVAVGAGAKAFILMQALALDFEPARGIQLATVALRSMERSLTGLGGSVPVAAAVISGVLRDLALIMESIYSPEMYWNEKEVWQAKQRVERLHSVVTSRLTTSPAMAGAVGGIIDLRRLGPRGERLSLLEKKITSAVKQLCVSDPKFVVPADILRRRSAVRITRVESSSP